MPDLKSIFCHLKHAGRMLVGMPDYDNYVAHQKAHHPDAPVMSRTEFFRNRQDSRYGGGVGKISRCC